MFSEVVVYCDLVSLKGKSKRFSSHLAMFNRVTEVS